jgi:predicted ATPase
MFGVWLAALVQAQNARAIEMTREMDAFVEEGSDRYAAHAAHAMSGHSNAMMGNQLEARRHYLACFELGRSFDVGTKNAKTLSYGLDVEVSGYAYSAWTEWLLGYPETALDRQRKALEQVERSNQSYSRARALYWAAVVDQFCGDYRAVCEKTDRAIENARRQGLTMVEAACRILSISAHSDLGEGGSADELGAAVNAYTTTGARFQTSYHNALYARLLAAEGRIDEGLDVLTRNLQMIQETGEEFFLPEVIRLRGELLLARDKGSDEAPTLFRQAIDMAANRQVRSLELRGATSLAEWHSRNGDSEAARNVISPVLSWFTQGSETRDLRHAQSVLEKL